MVKATIKTYDAVGQSVARCGRCGQALWQIQHNLPGGASELIEIHSKGYRYDESRCVWTPTETERAKYRAAAHRILMKRERPEDRNRVRDSRYHTGRRMRPGGTPSWTPAVAFEDAIRLPTNIECVRCGAINAVDVDLHNA